ncbi:hypothetical protein HRbin15_00206 [bacterium HR15]|nr:hypothetical protein HRbin15_00206 [bacterium HR15]
MRTTVLILNGLFLLTDAIAQEQARADASALGPFLLYLTLAAIGLVGLILRRERAQAHIRAIREGERALFWRGLAITAVALLLTILFGALGDSLKKAGDERTAGFAGLIALTIALAYLLLALLGFGSVAAVLGDAAAQLFGWRDLSMGWCVLLGSALFLLVVWIPVFGWALGVYWLALGIGGLWGRSEAKEAE